MCEPMRILVSGSRTWPDDGTIDRELTSLLPCRGSHVESRLLVHGACPTGADALASLFWTANGGLEEPHPADWDSCGPECRPSHRRWSAKTNRTYCPAAGPRRNAQMIALGADMCLVFIKGNSPGSSHMLRLATDGGIATRVFRL